MRDGGRRRICRPRAPEISYTPEKKNDILYLGMIALRPENANFEPKVTLLGPSAAIGRPIAVRPQLVIFEFPRMHSAAGDVINDRSRGFGRTQEEVALNAPFFASHVNEGASFVVSTHVIGDSG
ncbi:hypothetical protein [Bradyrhizobium neotropicale]|uniref:hypothetical protein n=1 Tax=Bradyrhizobium neotropicale TaxID=1497615 RepID=UPI00191B9DA9|nr:hypothetical protein [Bradyrhizobium neotropicale]